MFHFKEIIYLFRHHILQTHLILIQITLIPEGSRMVLKNMKIKSRLMVGFGIVLSLFVICGVITTLLLMKSDRSVKVVREESMPFALTAKDIAFHVVQVQQFLTDVSATHDTGVLTAAEDSAVKFRQDAAKFREMYRVKNDQESLRKLEELESSFNNYYE